MIGIHFSYIWRWSRCFQFIGDVLLVTLRLGLPIYNGSVLLWVLRDSKYLQRGCWKDQVWKWQRPIPFIVRWLGLSRRIMPVFCYLLSEKRTGGQVAVQHRRLLFGKFFPPLFLSSTIYLSLYLRVDFISPILQFKKKKTWNWTSNLLLGKVLWLNSTHGYLVLNYRIIFAYYLGFLHCSIVLSFPWHHWYSCLTLSLFLAIITPIWSPWYQSVD